MNEQKHHKETILRLLNDIKPGEKFPLHLVVALDNTHSEAQPVRAAQPAVMPADFSGLRDLLHSGMAMQQQVQTQQNEHQQARRGTLLAYAEDIIAQLREEGCDPSEVFAVASLVELLVRDQSRIVDVSPDECDMIWKEDV